MDKLHWKSATEIAALIRRKSVAGANAVLGLATGSTPQGVYDELVRLHRTEGLSFANVVTFKLDEYWPMEPGPLQSYRRFMQEHLFDHVNLVSAKTHVPDGLAQDIAAYAQEYEDQIRAAGGIDLQLLGIGDNGHIAFNEPGSPGNSRTRRVDLTEETIQANSRFFSCADEVPTHAITMGIGTILEAKRIILMATGERKADAVEHAIQGPIDAMSPASQLQRNREVTFVLDTAAAARLSAG